MERFYRHFTDDVTSWLLLAAGFVVAIITDAPQLLGLVALGLTVACAVEMAATQMPAWRMADMVAAGIVVFALLLERGGMLPASIAFILISSLGLEEFKPGELCANTVIVGLFGVELFAPSLMRF